MENLEIDKMVRMLLDSLDIEYSDDDVSTIMSHRDKKALVAFQLGCNLFGWTKGFEIDRKRADKNDINDLMHLLYLRDRNYVIISDDKIYSGCTMRNMRMETSDFMKMVTKKKFKDIWENGLVSFDTCCLGRMYEWEYLYAVNIKDAISYLYQTGKLWETEVNIQEFSKQRKEIRESIYAQKYENGILKNLKKRPIPWNKIDGTMGRWEARGFSETFINEIKKLYGKKQITDEEFRCIVEMSKRTSQQLNVEQLFDDLLVSDGVTLSEIEKLTLLTRYESGEICPGCKDRGKNNGNKYNDLYIWELLKKKAQNESKDVIFVTMDTKEDWFKNKLPRPEYIKEFRNETGQEIVILTLTDFWENCKDYLDLSIDKFIEISSIRDQIEEKYDDCYQEEICEKIENLLMESDEIKEELENVIDCCVDMPVLDDLVETIVEDIEVCDYEQECVYITIYLKTEACFDAVNHTACEDWLAGHGSVVLSIIASAYIPIIWASEDTNRKVLADNVCVECITDIEVCADGSTNQNELDCDEDYGENEWLEGDDFFEE